MNNPMSPGDSLSSVFEIEEVLQQVKDAEGAVEYLQNLKKHRDKVIADQVSMIKGKIDTWRQVILNTMEAHEPTMKTLPFPGVGKVTRRKISGSWSVDNEDIMLEYLGRSGMKDDVVETKEVINRRKLKSALDLLDKQNETVPGVSKGADREGVSISFEDEDAAPKPKKQKQKAPVDIGDLAV